MSQRASDAALIGRHQFVAWGFQSLFDGENGMKRYFQFVVCCAALSTLVWSGSTICAQDSPARLVEGQGGGSAAASVDRSDSDPLPLLSSAGPAAAIVNGTPILISEILAPFEARLDEIESAVTAAQFAELQSQLIAKQLPRSIETALLVDSIQSQLEPRRSTELEEQIGADFDTKLAQLMSQYDVESIDELKQALSSDRESVESRLHVSGRTREELRRSFVRHRLAMISSREAVDDVPPLSESELLAEYRSRIAEFTEPLKVEWKQIRISFDAHGGRSQARQVLNAVQSELAKGASFDDVAAKFSDGPRAALGGHWDWTQLTSISDVALRDTLNGLAIGDVGGVIDGEKSFIIAQMTGRQAAQVAPFEEVKGALRKELTQLKQKQQVADVLQELVSNAEIETMFDGTESDPIEAIRPPERQVPQIAE